MFSQPTNIMYPLLLVMMNQYSHFFNLQMIPNTNFYGNFANDIL